MRKKRLLFVGDLRIAGNYGAIATTEALNNLLVSNAEMFDIEYIDYRSLHNETPENGWPEIKSLSKIYKKKKIKTQIFAIVVPFLKMIKPLLFGIIGKKVYMFQKDYIPYKLSLYEEYYKRLVKGSSFRYEKRMLEWADIVYINGEGNIVNGTDKNGKYRKGGLYILFFAWLSKVKFNKKTCLLNHTVDPANKDIYEIIKYLYPTLDKVFVRETLSLKNLHDLGLMNVKYVPDALFSYQPKMNWEPSEQLNKQIDFTKPYLCIGDSSGIKNAYNKVKWDVPEVIGELINELRKIVPQIVFVDGYNGMDKDINRVIKRTKVASVNLNNCSYHDLYYVLKGAEIFISGRWHASILCVLANTPILLWGSDSHKTRSLYTLLDYPYDFFEVNTLPIHIAEMIENVKEILQTRSEIKDLIKLKVDDISKLAINNVNFLSELI